MNDDGLIKKPHMQYKGQPPTGGHNIIRRVTTRDFSLLSDISPLSVLLPPAINPAETQHSTH